MPPGQSSLKQACFPQSSPSSCPHTTIERREAGSLNHGISHRPWSACPQTGKRERIPLVQATVALVYVMTNDLGSSHMCIHTHTMPFLPDQSLEFLLDS